MKKQKQKGFTIIELVVGVGVMLLLGVVIVPILLGHIHETKLAHGTEDFMNVNTALRSALLQNGGSLPAPGDGNYMQVLLDQHFIDRAPQSLDSDGPWQILKTTVNNADVYYLDIPCSNDICQKLVAEVDGRSDTSSGASEGNLQWTF